MSNILLRTGQRLAAARCVMNQVTASYYNKAKIGNRDVVGFGINGEPSYCDYPLYPMPAIRFRENTPEVLALREKEKGDWKKLTIEEKKALYRASFCQTFAEMTAPTGQWKLNITGFLVISSCVMWFYMWMRKYVSSDLHPSLTDESKKAQLKRMIDLKVNPITGLASKWDYEKGKWKE